MSDGTMTENTRGELNRNSIDVQDLPKCESKKYKKSIGITKAEILPPHLERSDIFYNKWKKEEINIFEKLYVKLSRSGKKNHVFESIANNLPNKTTGDCVQYYYLFKHIRSFKTKSRKNKKKKQKHGASQPRLNSNGSP